MKDLLLSDSVWITGGFDNKGQSMWKKMLWFHIEYSMLSLLRPERKKKTFYLAVMDSQKQFYVILRNIEFSFDNFGATNSVLLVCYFYLSKELPYLHETQRRLKEFFSHCAKKSIWLVCTYVVCERLSVGWICVQNSFWVPPLKCVCVCVCLPPTHLPPPPPPLGTLNLTWSGVPAPHSPFTGLYVETSLCIPLRIPSRCELYVETSLCIPRGYHLTGLYVETSLCIPHGYHLTGLYVETSLCIPRGYHLTGLYVETSLCIPRGYHLTGLYVETSLCIPRGYHLTGLYVETSLCIPRGYHLTGLYVETSLCIPRGYHLVVNCMDKEKPKTVRVRRPI